MVSERLASIPESTTMKISAMAKKLNAAGLDVIDLGVGEPDFDTPTNICDAAINSLQRGDTHYIPTSGIPELRAAIAEKLYNDNGIEVSPDLISVVPGAKMAIFAAIQALLDEGDECVLIGPSWVSYEPSVNFAGGRVRWAEVDEEFKPRDLVESITSKTKMILVNSPSNPTGAVFGREILEEIRDIALDHDLMVLSDEIYEKIVYGQDHLSIGSFPEMAERTVTVNGFSKCYAMTGWRLGYLAGPQEIMKWVNRILSHSVSHATTFVQWAGIEALKGPQDSIKAMVAEFRERRDLLVSGLAEIGIDCPLPGGAFYVFPDVSDFGGGDGFAERMLSEAMVAATPGSAFGPGGVGNVRISYAASKERLQEALGRIAKMLE
ncbi:MAG: pyridoxal phosphate-dependent aminotransferase [Methanothrix sp.]|uniref:Aminotransferase n=1 Tax=Methanothrix harundinacea TaxID=301375 RepID=A0A101FUK7_9EURY|nr:MAG: Aspartate aminotransferase [Methanothrix harundinacea]MDD2638593.1 pyridoxal phosphate-dependent aminotransferase [Methanothrix sp.]MDI9399026.1 pyridoxal phosphate-dependent aminotransferase [Euryarchaeota archaeon]KUK95937.1 MAG: Aspartate aminotransferase [Methanothrix harundinacea]MCP1391865.1 pyridoxal phosphate-dependent aminotransferase [Methanothrix harundinacea]